MFRQANLKALVKFNSAVSSDILDSYEGFVLDKISKEKSEPSSKTFAPSGFRCKRKMWFRLRGSQPDVISNPDYTLDFKARIGTYCHTIIQSNLKTILNDDWIEVEDYLKDNPIPYEYSIESSELESKIEIFNPPVRFACDGIIRWKGEYYLIEIKTCDYADFENLTDPKPIHIDQVKCYSSLLNIPKVLFIYMDRQYGGMKCYEYKISLGDMKDILNQMSYIQDMADNNLAPERLDYSDYMCTNCEYKKKCKEWG